VIESRGDFIDSLYSIYIYMVQYFPSLSKSLSVEWVLESMSEITGSKELDAPTVAFGLTIAFIVHLLVKLLLGKNSVYIIVAVGVFAVRWLKRRQHLFSSEIEAIKTVSVLFPPLLSPRFIS
jgi:hypothetical protein